MDTIQGKIQIDIGFNDKITYGPIETEFPTLLNQENPKILIYSLESSIAEKFESIVKLNFISSRIKDFYDIYFLSKRYSFNSTNIKSAIITTFNYRNTDINYRHEIFSEKLKQDSTKENQWRGFVKRNELNVDITFESLIDRIFHFIEPVFHFEANKIWNPDRGIWE